MHDDESTRSGYPRYVLAVLLLVYVFNFLDRQILSILAEDIRADLGLSDASIGFLYGTAFAIFYAVFGIPLSRLADMSNRKNIIAAGLAVWSAMTALSGTARSFGSLAFFRVGVGIGEASATPAAFSMLCDYFSPKFRATVMAIYSSGVYIGGGIGIFLGGVILDGWDSAFPGDTAPFGLAGWQAAFMLVGLPGLLLAVWVCTLREPVRGRSEGIVTSPVKNSVPREFAVELASVLPGISLITLKLAGASGRQLGLNGVIALTTVVSIVALIGLTGSVAQWLGLGIGCYIFATWLQILALRDDAAFGMIYRSRALVYGEIGFGCIGFIAYGIGFWTAPYLIRAFDASASEVGTFIGMGAAIGGLIGASGGGLLSDRLKLRTPCARPYMGIAVAIGLVPCAYVTFTTSSVVVAYIASFVYSIVSSAWIGSAAALANEMVLPRMRAAASAFYIVCMTFIGLALGPYVMGRLSDALGAAGEPADALRTSILACLAVSVLAVRFFWLSARHIEAEESSRLERGRLLGEAV